MTVLALPRTTAADFLALGKPRIVALIVITVVAGFLVAPAPGPGAVALLHAVIGTTLVAAGTNALNQLFERDVDALMRRTERRPLAAGRLSALAGAGFGWSAGAGGIAWLAVFTNETTAALAALTLLSYVFLYTPLKRKSTLATLIGAVPGALPIVGGWTAGGGELGPGAWVLFWIMFLWQLPHFLALSWIYREDYRRAGLRMLSVTDGDGSETFRQASLYAMALVPVSLVPTLLGLSGATYFVGALVLSGWLVGVSLSAARARSPKSAGRLFAASNLYLPVLLLLMVLNRT
ncbi:MAG: protoheme IX farnesyltransferase [Gemmatimonadetes bacterium]|nr:protoheme IX farnesyltransferase [Gemmatimonadota bacterium]